MLFLLDADVDALAERLADAELRVLVVAEPVVLEAVEEAEVEVTPCISFLTVWLKVPVMLSSVKIAEKER